MPVPQENLLFVEQASCLFKKGLLTMVQYLSIETMCKMPVPQENLLFVEQASCLFKPGLLTMVQYLCIETMRVTGTLSPRLRCKLNAVKLNVIK
ncbi:hypothetical protein QUB70_06240 [Microcoleus sp. A003_D6]|uniref:hypothetical protein n=1 Tax=Microcoleus sp. A003_D6 TaxID=3055266 RepID=UPI002FD589AA